MCSGLVTISHRCYVMENRLLVPFEASYFCLRVKTQSYNTYTREDVVDVWLDFSWTDPIHMPSYKLLWDFSFKSQLPCGVWGKWRGGWCLKKCSKSFWVYRQNCMVLCTLAPIFYSELILFYSKSTSNSKYFAYTISTHFAHMTTDSNWFKLITSNS